jgi:hypothetical protein
MKKIKLSAVYKPSEDVVAREIEGELIIVPISSGIGNMEDELYTLNETGRAIWKKLDGRKSLIKIIEELSKEYTASNIELQKDAAGLLEELLKRNMIVESSRT